MRPYYKLKMPGGFVCPCSRCLRWRSSPTELRARALMRELFDLSLDHYGIEVPSSLEPSYSFRFTLGGHIGCRRSPEQNVFRLCTVEATHRSLPSPPTDIAIAAGMLLLTDEMEFAKQLRPWSLMSKGWMYEVAFMAEEARRRAEQRAEHKAWERVN